MISPLPDALALAKCSAQLVGVGSSSFCSRSRWAAHWSLQILQRFPLTKANSCPLSVNSPQMSQNTCWSDLASFSGMFVFLASGRALNCSCLYYLFCALSGAHNCEVQPSTSFYVMSFQLPPRVWHSYSFLWRQSSRSFQNALAVVLTGAVSPCSRSIATAHVLQHTRHLAPLA